MWIGRYWVRVTRDRALFSERNRIKTCVVPLLFGWRVVVRG